MGQWTVCSMSVGADFRISGKALAAEAAKSGGVERDAAGRTAIQATKPSVAKMAVNLL